MKVAIFGAGPAGMSCANACLSFGLVPVVIENRGQVGGTQRSNFHPNLWMLGFPQESGQDMTRRISEHFLGLPVELHRQTEVERAERVGDGFALSLAGPAGRLDLKAGAMVLSTGMLPRATPELEALSGQSPRIIVGPLSNAIRDEVRAARVLILGGGDNALDHALFLAERGNTVRVCTRRGFSARRPFREACAARPEIELRADCTPDEIVAEQDAVRVAWGRIRVRYDWLLVMYGYVANTTVLERFDAALLPRMTADGHIEVDRWQRTSVPGLYAAGDVTANPQPSVPTAIAQGLAAAKAIERDGQAGAILS